jgi:hypothetical protein
MTVAVAVAIRVVVAPVKLAPGILFAGHAALCELLHHFDELLAVILEQVVGHRQDAA